MEGALRSAEYHASLENRDETLVASAEVAASDADADAEEASDQPPRRRGKRNRCSRRHRGRRVRSRRATEPRRRRARRWSEAVGGGGQSACGDFRWLQRESRDVVKRFTRRPRSGPHRHPRADGSPRRALGAPARLRVILGREETGSLRLGRRHPRRADGCDLLRGGYSQRWRFSDGTRAHANPRKLVGSTESRLVSSTSHHAPRGGPCGHGVAQRAHRGGRRGVRPREAHS